MWVVAISTSIGVAAGLVGGIFLEKVLRSLKDNRILKCSELLEESFGKSTFCSSFSLAEVKDWFVNRQDEIKDGYKGIVLKINNDTFKQFGIEIAIAKDLKNFLLLGVYKDGSFRDTLLIKYNSLDSELITALKEGALVIE